MAYIDFISKVHKAAKHDYYVVRVTEVDTKLLENDCNISDPGGYLSISRE
jgi:hypothetical protein